MPHLIVDLPSSSHRKQQTDPTALSREVWRHASVATSQGLHPIVELYSHKSKHCKQLTRFWTKQSQLRDDTLDGMYLIRINLLEHGPKPVLMLTQRVGLGIPLLVAWNPKGQVLSPAEFGSFDGTEFVAALSAFFEDVAADVPFRLEPPAERRARKRRSAAAPPAQNTLAVPTTRPAPNVLALSQQLDAYVDKAREVAVQYLEEHELLCDFSLESLVDLDTHILENGTTVGEALPLQQMLRKAVGALAVYFGETIRGAAGGTWYVDTAQSSLVQALRLRIAHADRIHEVVPAQIVLDALESESLTLFGQGAELSGLLDDAQARDSEPDETTPT